MRIKPIMYDHERPYIPSPKYELADILAKNSTPNKLEEPENKGKSYEEVYWELHNDFMKLNKKTLYRIYFDSLGLKPKQIKVSKLEKKTQKLQLKLF